MLNRISFSMFLKILIPIVLISCIDPANGNKKVVKDEMLQKSFSRPATGFSDTLRIYNASVVIYSLDSNQLSSMKAVTNPGVFDAMAHEFFYLLKNARVVIQRNHPKIELVEAKDVRFILFKTEKIDSCIDLDTRTEPYGLFAFNMVSEPKHVDLANVDTELYFYFFKS